MTLPDVKVVNFASKYIMYLLPLEVIVPLTSTLCRPQVLLNSFRNIKDNEQRKARSLCLRSVARLFSETCLNIDRICVVRAVETCKSIGLLRTSIIRSIFTTLEVS